jgi:glycosyltransferase involved in cell wall biosynthesis
MGTPSRKILLVASCWPHQRSFGGQLRALHIGRALQQLGEVTVAVVSPDAADESTARQPAEEFRLARPVRVRLSPNRGVRARLRWGLDPRFLNVHGCVADEADRAHLLSRFDEFELLWVLNARTPNILNLWSWPRSVLDLDDVPSTFQRTIWQNGAGLKEKLKAGLQMLLLKRRELRLKERFTALAVCSEADRRYLGGGSSIHVIPNGFQRPPHEPQRRPIHPPRIGFVGLFSYPPNSEGVRWFVKECWSQIKAEVPETRLRLVGKDTDGPLRPDGPDIDALGWVDDPTSEIATWSAMIIPMRYGAGTRVKVADAFSRKCPVVSTHLGAFGYEVQHGRELLLADTTVDFAQACLDLVQEPRAGAAMAERAFAAFLKHWTWEAIRPRVWAAAEHVFNRPPPHEQPTTPCLEMG